MTVWLFDQGSSWGLSRPPANENRFPETVAASGSPVATGRSVPRDLRRFAAPRDLLAATHDWQVVRNAPPREYKYRVSAMHIRQAVRPCRYEYDAFCYPWSCTVTPAPLPPREPNSQTILQTNKPDRGQSVNQTRQPWIFKQSNKMTLIILTV